MLRKYHLKLEPVLYSLFTSRQPRNLCSVPQPIISDEILHRTDCLECCYECIIKRTALCRKTQRLEPHMHVYLCDSSLSSKFFLFRYLAICTPVFFFFFQDDSLWLLLLKHVISEYFALFFVQIYERTGHKVSSLFRVLQGRPQRPLCVNKRQGEGKFILYDNHIMYAAHHNLAYVGQVQIFVDERT